MGRRRAITEEALKTLKKTTPVREKRRPNDAIRQYAKPSAALVRVKSTATVSVALAASILQNQHTLQLRTALAGQIARSMTIFRVDEVIIFGFDSTDSRNIKFLSKQLSFLETPQYLRKALFPLEADLKFAGTLPPLNSEHHVKREDYSEFREAVVMGNGRTADAGLDHPVPINKRVTVNTRITVNMDSGEVVGRDIPKARGMYWGYEVREAATLSAVWDECPYEEGYDVSIGTSERGRNVDSVKDDLPGFKHLLLVFGGPEGLEEAHRRSESLQEAYPKPEDLFDWWLNTCPIQGSKSIRTEEAIPITLACLRTYLFPPSTVAP